MAQYNFEREQGEVLFFLAFAAIAGVGAWLGSGPFALFGIIGALSCAALFVWQRDCLRRLTYVRRVSAERANFGEEIAIECDLINDKLLPLPWVRTVDQFPVGLDFEGVRTKQEDKKADLVQLYAMLPYQKTTRRLYARCNRRGRHVFGASVVFSGDPLGIQERSRSVERREELIVYPKRFVLSPSAFSSRTPIGDLSVKRLIMDDPSRVAGMRTYRPGDPMRHIDWRASARSRELLVRNFEPTATLRTITFLDLAAQDEDHQEFLIALGASIVSDFAASGFATGLFAAASADGLPVAYEATSAPSTIRVLLELLALCEPDKTRTLPTTLAIEADRLPQGATVVIVSSHFDLPLLTAIANCQRRASITAIFVDGPGSIAPPVGSVDRIYRTDYLLGWQERDDVVLAS